jgi:hypothetical protein
VSEDCSPCDSHIRPLRLGRIVDLPRRSLKRFFDGFKIASCDTGCNPCDAVCDDPCGHIDHAPADTKLPAATR